MFVGSAHLEANTASKWASGECVNFPQETDATHGELGDLDQIRQRESEYAFTVLGFSVCG